MRTYVSKRVCPDEKERLMVRDVIRTASNTILRVGELRNMKWKDNVAIERVFDEDENEINLVTINVRPEISKTGTGRRVPGRGGEYIERVRARVVCTEPDDYVFCAKVQLSAIAKLAGTGLAHVENTYGHYDDAMLLGASMKNSIIGSQGIIHPKSLSLKNPAFAGFPMRALSHYLA